MGRNKRPPQTQQQQRLARIIDEAKSLSVYAGIEWENYRWEITKYEQPRGHEKHSLVLIFNKLRQNKKDPPIPYDQPYADFAKAIIRIRASERNLSHSGHAHMILALRHLYDALERSGRTDPTELTRKHFQVAALSGKKLTNGWTQFHIGRSLQQIADWLDEREITERRIRFINPIASPPRGDRLDAESQAKGLEKMPSARSLELLADISNDPLDDNERIMMRTIDLMVVGGFRIGEALTLPLDCWVESQDIDQNGIVKTDPLTGEQVKRYGIRYWPEKGGEPYVKWLPELAVPLAKRAVDDLTRLCAEARAVALTLEQNPDRVPLPGQRDQDELVTYRQLAEICGLRDLRCARHFFSCDLGVQPTEQRGKTRTAFFKVRDIEEALIKRRRNMMVIRKSNGQVQMLSQSLCVIFRNQFAGGRATIKLLPELMGIDQIGVALGQKDLGYSIFARRNITELDGSPIRIRSHAFRHWINTLLARGGLSDTELARWSGRRDEKQNAAYKHGMLEQRVAWVQEMIRVGRLHGPVADTYHAIDDPVEKEVFLQTFVNVAHFTPYGVCTHEFAIEPCRFHLNCLSGCLEYLRTKGDAEERSNIEAVLRFHLVQLEHSVQAKEEGIRGASNYEDHNRRIVEGAKAALAVDEIDLPDNQLVKVFPSGEKLGEPVATETYGTYPR